MDNYFVMDADDELMQKLEEFYFSKLFNPFFLFVVVLVPKMMLS